MANGKTEAGTADAQYNVALKKGRGEKEVRASLPLLELDFGVHFCPVPQLLAALWPNEITQPTPPVSRL